MPCRSAYNHQYYKQNRAKMRAYADDYRRRNPRKDQKRDYTLRHRYGIGTDDYERLLVVQDGRCAVCGRIETARHNNGQIRRLAVDHDHESGEIRGLLCSRCNRRIGAVVDDPDWLRRAIEYTGVKVI